MDLTKVISISGMPGLYKVLAQSKNGFVVESLLDGKRAMAYSHYKISGLDDISIFTTGDDKPLRDVYKNIFDKEKGGQAIPHKSTDDELRNYFESALPEYDKERVNISDIRKAIQWYNILQKTDLLTAEPEKTDDGIDVKSLTDDGKKTSQLNIKDTNQQVKTAGTKVKTQGVRKTGTA
jgi:hypothetical protein